MLRMPNSGRNRRPLPLARLSLQRALASTRRFPNSCWSPDGHGPRHNLRLEGGQCERSRPHKGTCAHLDPSPAYALKDVKDGKSVTTVHNLNWATLMKGHYAINVHKSATDTKTYVACGDL